MKTLSSQLLNVEIFYYSKMELQNFEGNQTEEDPPNEWQRKKINYFNYLKKVLLPLVAVGLFVGLFAGAIVGVYNYLAEILVEYTLKLFEMVHNEMKWLPLAFVIEIAIGLIIGFLIYKFSEIRGSGIPYIESVARGNLKLTWYISLPLMFITSLLSLFSGMSLGSEGPSVYMGGCIGYGFGKLLKLPKVHDMLLVSAGSAAGLSVAFNSPISGLIFSLEEVYRKFSTQIILSSIISVSLAQMITHLIFTPNMLDIGLLPKEDYSIKTFGIALITGVVGGLFGALFNITIRASPKLYTKIKCLKMPVYVILPCILSVVLGIWWNDVSTGGAAIMRRAITNDITIEEAVISFVVKFLYTCLCFGSKASGGIFIPMLSIGSLLGAIVGKVCLLADMSPEKYSSVVLMCISAFFTGVVRAPLTAAILPVEYTGTFAGFCGPITAVAIAYFAAELTRVTPLYEALMEPLIAQDSESGQEAFKYSFTVTLESMICGLSVREVILPEETVITKLIRGGIEIVPTEDTQIFEGDEVQFQSQTTNPDYVEEQLSMIF